MNEKNCPCDFCFISHSYQKIIFVLWLCQSVKKKYYLYFHNLPQKFILKAEWVTGVFRISMRQICWSQIAITKKRYESRSSPAGLAAAINSVSRSCLAYVKHFRENSCYEQWHNILLHLLAASYAIGTDNESAWKNYVSLYKS